MHKKLFTPIMIQTLLLALFLIAAPFAMSFTADANTCADMPLQPDPLYTVRAILIIGGLLGAILSVAMLFREFIKSRSDYIVLQMSMTLCSFTIGWLFFPFWVNGVFQAYRGNGPDCTLNLYDPQDLMPAIWVGIIWYLPAIYTYPIVILSGLVLFLLAIFLLLKDRDWKQGIPSLICLAITATIIFIFPDCATWIID